MKKILLLVFFGNLMCINAQYLFTGEVTEGNENLSVYLSLVENYRKSSRVYANQIIKEVKTDANGLFKFEGDNLISENRIYRIHIDGCEEDGNGGGHFLRDCNYTRSVLFIAKKADTISFPLLQNNQALCEIASTNENSGLLLGIDALKEEMILDFMEYSSKANESLNFQKWFSTFQEYGKRNKEPLADLYTYSFLSDRASETHAYYINDVKLNSYYDELTLRLNNKYPNASFTSRYQNELEADKVLRNDLVPKSRSSFWPYLLWGGVLFLIIQVGYFNFKRRQRKEKKNPFDTLTAQERTVMVKISEGKSNKEIASELFISLSTVKSHINNLYKKLGISSREELNGLF
ncbi:helix-turn-helix transcriptional regulator [uncultured Croceitalea sp.]|uniref:helix-turn-helix domain-containing protein n=1 Tax=uncultured Croceitalea sp. TaxID=1798908 RepID=UPI003305E3EF